MEREVGFWVGRNNVIVEIGGDAPREQLENVVRALARHLGVTRMVRSTQSDSIEVWRGVMDGEEQ